MSAEATGHTYLIRNMPDSSLPRSSVPGRGSHPYLQAAQPIVPPVGIPLLPDESIWEKKPEYINELEYKCTNTTVDVIDRTLRDLQIFLARDIPSPDNIIKYLRNRLTLCRWKAATANATRGRLSGFFEWAVRRNYILRNPVEVVPVLAEFKPNRPIFTEPMFRELQQVSRGSYLYYLVTVAWYTGVRISDACLMKWEHIDFAKGRITFVPYKTRKRGVVVDLLLNEELTQLFTDLSTLRTPESVYCHPEAALTYLRNAGGAVGSLLQKTMKKMKGPLHPDLTFHCLRHSRATRMLNGENKVDVMTAANVLGLTNISTLARYVTVGDGEKEKAMKA